MRSTAASAWPVSCKRQAYFQRRARALMRRLHSLVFFLTINPSPIFIFSHSCMIKIDIRASCSRHCSMARAGCGRRRLCVKANVSTGGRGTAAKVRNTILFSQNNIKPHHFFLFHLTFFFSSLLSFSRNLKLPITFAGTPLNVCVFQVVLYLQLCVWSFKKGAMLG